MESIDMNSDQNPNLEDPEGQSAQSEPEKETSSPLKKSPEKHAKGRRRKRGGQQNRKHRKSSTAHAESENHEDRQQDPSATTTSDWNSDEDLEGELNAYSDVIIRPVDVPKAPENSTQFIMDDHNECYLYMSFETPNPYVMDTSGGSHGEGLSSDRIDEDEAYNDIDWEYARDLDNNAYFDRDFEQSYKSNRFDELCCMPRAELISGLHVLEAQLQNLTELLMYEDPSSILEKLQAELLDLQEKHLSLKEVNTKLTALLESQGGSEAADSTKKTPDHTAEQLQQVPVLEYEVPSEAEANENLDPSSFAAAEDEPCQSGIVHSCSEMELTDDQAADQPLMYNEDSGDEVPHSTVADDLEMGVIAV